MFERRAVKILVAGLIVVIAAFVALWYALQHYAHYEHLR
jgi:hypothetical protein